MKKMRLLTLLALALLANASFAQSLQVSGVVTDPSGDPLIGAVVSATGTSKATATDVDGVYTLQNVPSTATLTFSYIGMKTSQEPVNGRTKIDCQLSENAIQAEAVVVTALGVKRPTKALGYAVQEVSGQKLLETRSVNVANALTGQIAGLQVVKGAGGPGASTKIILRGQTSLTGSNQPLIVVDGVPMDNFMGANSTEVWGNTQGHDFGNGLNDINQEDIEAMTVLKGPSAAALYGSRAGNGVILITTKSGRSNPGLGITVSGGISIENILVKPALQNTFSQGLNGAYDPKSTFSWGVEANVGNQGQVWDKATNGWINGNINTYDNIGNFFRTGLIDTETVTFQQQVKRTSVYASITRMNDESMIPETNLNRTSITARATTNLGQEDRWKLDFKINYINNKAQNRPVEGINSDNAFYTINNLPRSLNIADFNPSIDPTTGKQIWWDKESTPQNNPWWNLQYNKNQDQRNRFLSFISLSYKFTDWLSLELKGGMDYYNTYKTTKTHAYGLGGTGNGRYSEGTDTFLEANYSFLLIAQKDNLFGKFGGAFTLGGNMMDQNRRSINAKSGELNVPNIFSLNNGKEKPSVSSSEIHRKMNSLYGSLALNWNRAIFLEATLRNDWSSTMSKENMSYMYPSVSTSIVISDLVEAMPSWMDFAKIRASYAEVGNDLSPYQLATTYGVGLDIFGHVTANRGNTLYDPSVRSELVTAWEAGFEVRFLQSRLRLDAAYYKSNSTRQLLDLAMDPSSGYSSRKVNAGNIQNEGIEITLGASIFRKPDGFNWDASLNLTHNRNTIQSLYKDPNGNTTYDVNSYELGNVDGQVMVVAGVNGGYGDIYGSRFLRVTEGEYAGRLLLTAEGLPQRDGMKYAPEYLLGNQQPDMMIGFNNSMSWKGISFDFNFDARLGGKVFSMTNAVANKTGSAANTVVNGKRESFLVSGVVQQKDGSFVENNVMVSPQQYYSNAVGVGNVGIAEAYTYDATSVRLRMLSLGYALPQKILAGSGFQRVKFAVTANNLWLIYSAVPGVDPEAVSGTGTNATGLELGVAPTTRSFTFNLTLGF